MNELEIMEYKKTCKEMTKTYAKFLAAIYAVYIIFIVMLYRGGAILDWFGEKFDQIKSKFKRKEADDFDFPEEDLEF